MQETCYFMSTVGECEANPAFMRVTCAASCGFCDDEAEVDSVLGELHRRKLRRLLAWPRARIWSKLLMPSLPLSFLRERSLLLGWLGWHEAMLRIFYFDLKSLGLVLEYCDTRYER